MIQPRIRKTLTLIAPLVLALLTSACQTGPSAQSPAARQERAVAVSGDVVRRGDINQTLSYSGDIRATGQVTVLPRTNGRIERLLVDVGKKVSAGDILAQLDSDTANLQVIQAQAALSAAEARLALIRAGGRAEDIAASQAALAGQQARLESMLAGGRADDIAVAEAGLEAAQARLDLLKKGATNDLRQAARGAVDSDVSAVTAAEAALANLGGSSAADLQAAQSAYDTALAQRDGAQAALDQADSPIDAQVAQATQGVAEAEAGVRAARSRVTELREGTSVTAGPCYRNPVGNPNNARSSPGACSTSIDAALSAVTSAERALATARAQESLLGRGGAPASQAQLRSQIEQAAAAMRAARAKIDAIGSGGIEAQRTLLESQLVAAQERLRADRARLEQVIAGPQDEEIRQADAAVEQARLQLEKARAPYTSYDLEQQQQAVVQADATLQGRRQPYQPAELDNARATVDQARAQLDLARLGVRDAMVMAPVDGIVSERLVSPGALVSPATPLFTLVPPGLEIVVQVEELQLRNVAEGQAVNVEAVAFPGDTFRGRVVAISPTVDVKSRTATVKVEPIDPAGRLRAGMFSRVNIVTADKQGVLLVPREAVPGAASGAQATVLTVDEGSRVRKMPIRVGLVGDRHVEVLSGLAEGQIVATSGLADLSDGDLVAPQLETRPVASRQ